MASEAEGKPEAGDGAAGAAAEENPAAEEAAVAEETPAAEEAAKDEEMPEAEGVKEEASAEAEAEAPPPQVDIDAWPVEDDVALRRAMELGVSSDSLATRKEAMSKEYSVEEIRGRWRAMLYDREFSPKCVERMKAHLEANPPKDPGAWPSEALREMWRLRAGGGEGGQVPVFHEVEQMVFEAREGEAGAGEGAPSEGIWGGEQLREHATELAQLEAALDRGVMRAALREAGGGDALAILVGHQAHFLVRNEETTIGRRVPGEPKVDIDLAKEEGAEQVSRQQAILHLKRDGTFQVKNIGRRTMKVNNKPLEHGKRRRLPNRSLVEIGGLPFVFQVNQAGVHRALKRV